MKLKFNGGANQIGGNSVFISTQKTCLLLDAGIAVTGETKLIPNVDNIDAVIFSHSHIDHYGQLEDLPANIPIYCTKIAWCLIQSSRIFNKKPLFTRQVNFIKAYEEFAIGDLLIKPYPMDHSAPDSMAFLISGAKNRIFYTGDFRGHGRKEKCFQHLLKRPPQDIDLLIIEGTMLGRDTDAISDEKSVETRMTKCLKDYSDLPFFLSTSPQNVDRMVSCYRAATKSKRILVLDIYSAWILRQLQLVSKNIPDLSWDNIRVIANGKTASRHYGIMKSNPDFFQKFTRELYEDGNLQSLEELTKNPSRYFIKTSYIQDVAKKCNFTNFGVIYSLWSGYIKDDSRLLSLQKSSNVHFEEIHSGGHASQEELQALIAVIKPAKIVSLHTEHAEMLVELTNKVQMVNSGSEINL